MAAGTCARVDGVCFLTCCVGRLCTAVGMCGEQVAFGWQVVVVLRGGENVGRNAGGPFCRVLVRGGIARLLAA